MSSSVNGGPFELVLSNAHMFSTGIHTMGELLKSSREYSNALTMIEACRKHKDLEPGIKDFQDEIQEIEDFFLLVTEIYSANGMLES